MTDFRFTRRDLLLGGSALAAATLTGTPRPADARPSGPQAKQGPTVGDRAPELAGTPGDWLNTGGKALRLYGKGGLLDENHLCLLDFWEYTCVNCVRTLPYLKEWHARYARHGLTIVGIHTPEFAFAKLRDNVVASAKEFGLEYPILLDADYRNWNNFKNLYWPRKYLIDTNGRIVYDHAGEGDYGRTETMIQRALKRKNPKLVLPQIMEPVRGSDKPGAVCYPQTREIYCGYWRSDGFFGSPPGLRKDVPAVYSDVPAAERKDGVFYAKGEWRVLNESVRHARATANPWDDYLALSYRALETNAVIRPEGGNPFDLFVLHDGKPVTKDAAGADIRYAADGQSFLRVDAPRMYQILKNRRWGKHELRLGTTSEDFGLYSFTFASCAVGGDS